MKARKSNIYPVSFARKRYGKTNYRKRMALLKSDRERIVIRKSLKSMMAQIIRFDPKGDVVIASAHSNELKKYGFKTSGGNIPAAYLVGLLIGKKAVQKGIKEAIADIGLSPSTKGSRIYSLIKGAVDAGLKVPVDPEMFPPTEKIEGKIIENYARMLEQKKEAIPFSDYHKNKVNPSEASKYFEDVKKKIMGGKS